MALVTEAAGEPRVVQQSGGQRNTQCTCAHAREVPHQEQETAESVTEVSVHLLVPVSLNSCTNMYRLHHQAV